MGIAKRKDARKDVRAVKRADVAFSAATSDRTHEFPKREPALRLEDRNPFENVGSGPARAFVTPAAIQLMVGRLRREREARHPLVEHLYVVAGVEVVAQKRRLQERPLTRSQVLLREVQAR